MVARLYAESFAPWCEKARWALDHHGVAYAYREHVPLLGEVPLRRAARRLRGRVTVPLLIDGDHVLMSSFDIARYAERRGAGAPLFPVGLDDEVVAWNGRSEALMVSGRAMLLPRIQASRDALREQVPSFVPAVVRPAMTAVAALGVKHIVRKYEVRAGEQARYEAEARRALDALRARLAAPRTYLVGDTFSYADIAMAAALQFVLPVADHHIPLGRATREAWTHRGLAAEYGDLLAWRDELYARRPPREP